MKVRRILLFILSLALLVVLVVNLLDQKQERERNVDGGQQPSATTNNEAGGQNVSEIDENSTIGQDPHKEEDDLPVTEPAPTQKVEPDTDAESISVIVNPNYKLPENYEPSDLVYPEVRYTFNEKIEKRMLRQEAASALEHMFEAAEVDGIYLAGVSGYRSHSTQTALFNRYVERDGYEKAKTYSAEPGSSEHETGLAIDVTSSDGKCAAQDCFGGTVEAIWLENNAADYGFIIRYPKGKEEITGYKYEPWHIRYVGVELAQNLVKEELTLEEYYGAEPVKR